MTKPEVSASDRARFEAQMRSVALEESGDEGDARLQAVVRADLDARRAAAGRPRLREWWETKEESKLYERARSLGLLKPVR